MEKIATRNPTNTEIAGALDELADLSELDGAIIHRVVAYRNAAKTVREAPVSVLALARQGRATELPGTGQTIQEKGVALAIGEPLVAALRAHPAAERVELAGSARRMSDTVKDLDVIATASDPGALARAAAELELVESAASPGEAGVRLRTHTGIRVDL